MNVVKFNFEKNTQSCVRQIKNSIFDWKMEVSKALSHSLSSGETSLAKFYLPCIVNSLLAFFKNPIVFNKTKKKASAHKWVKKAPAHKWVLEYHFLYNKHALTPHFYHIPKVHKSEVDPPGRPIIAGIDSVSSNVGCYIDHFLQDIVTSLPSFVRDSSHMLEILSSYEWQPRYRWLSLDVASLYTSTDHKYGLRAANYYLSKDR